MAGAPEEAGAAVGPYRQRGRPRGHGDAGAAAGGGRGGRQAPGSGAAFAVQKLVNRKVPYGLQWSLLLAGDALAVGFLGSILVSSAAGSLASYAVTRAETQKCSDFWIYLETGKFPQELAMAGGVSQPAEDLPSPEDRGSAASLVRKNKYGDIVE
ncbi:transmembrane protein 141 isoform 1-T1 [Guaruba guarouba]